MAIPAVSVAITINQLPQSLGHATSYWFPTTEISSLQAPGQQGSKQLPLGRSKGVHEDGKGVHKRVREGGVAHSVQEMRHSQGALSGVHKRHG